MRNFVKLTLFLFKCGLGSAEKKVKKKRIGLSGKAAGILVGICMLPVMAMLFTMGKKGYELFAPMGLSHLVIQLACIAGGMVVFFLGISVVISVFYMTSDIESLLPLPLSSWQIVGAKWFMTLLYEYLWIVFFVVPILAGYGFAAHAGAAYWIGMIFGCLALPMVPLIYASLLSMIVMRLFRGIRNKDFLSILGFAISMILALGISVGSQAISAGQVDLVKMIQEKSGLIQTLGNVFPNFRFLANGLADGNLLQVLMFVVTSLLFVAVFLLIADKIYLKGVIGMSEASDKKRKLTRAEAAKAIRPRNPVYSYMCIELKKLLRTPVYFYNCALMCFIFPLFMIVPIIIALAGSGFAIGTIFRSSEVAELIRGFLSKPEAFAIVLLVVAGITIMVSSMNMTTGTSITREGSNYYIMKYLPMSYTDQLRAKVLSGSVLSILSALIYVILIEIFLITMGMNLLVLPVSILVVVLCVLLLNYVQLLMDLAYPKLVWESEAAAVKQNIPATIGVFLNLAVGLVVGGLAYVLYAFAGIPAYILIPVLLAVLAAIVFFIRRATYRYGEKRLAGLEE